MCKLLDSHCRPCTRTVRTPFSSPKIVADKASCHNQIVTLNRYTVTDKACIMAAAEAPIPYLVTLKEQDCCRRLGRRRRNRSKSACPADFAAASLHQNGGKKVGWAKRERYRSQHQTWHGFISSKLGRLNIELISPFYTHLAWFFLQSLLHTVVMVVKTETI